MVASFALPVGRLGRRGERRRRRGLFSGAARTLRHRGRAIRDAARVFSPAGNEAGCTRALPLSSALLLARAATGFARSAAAALSEARALRGHEPPAVRRAALCREFRR